MTVSEETLKKLSKLGPYGCRATFHAQAFVEQRAQTNREKRKRKVTQCPAQLRASQKRILFFLHCHLNTFTRVNTLINLLNPELIPELPNGKEVVDGSARTTLQTGICLIRRHLEGTPYEIRQIKSAGDRRVKAYGLFYRLEPDSSKHYIKHANLKQLHQDYSR